MSKLQKPLVEVFVRGTRKFKETVWAAFLEAVEYLFNEKYAQAGTVDTTEIKEVGGDE